MKMNLKKLACLGLIVLGSSAAAFAQSASPAGLNIDLKNVNKPIEIQVIFPSRPELYRGSASAPSQPITARKLYKKVSVTIPFLDIKNSDATFNDSASNTDTSALYMNVKTTFDSIQQYLLQNTDATQLYSSMTPKHDDPADKDAITGYSFNRAALQNLKDSTEGARGVINTAMQSGLSDYETNLDALLKQAGYTLDRDNVKITDNRKLDYSGVETPGELDSVAGVLIRGEKIENSDDYYWRLTLHDYVMKIEIPLKTLN